MANKETAIEKFVQKANKFLMIHILFFVGLILYGMAGAMYFNGFMPQIFKYSIATWAAISFGMEVIIRVIIMKCPVCGKEIKKNTKLTFFLPSECKHCGAVFSKKTEFNGESNG